jgi:dTDP-4-dehydrorhamnose 3,5-epimerase
MIFRETELSGAFVVTPEPVHDERGFLARTWCAGEFAAHGLNSRIAQCSVSFNQKTGTLRGLHYQSAPRAEAKLVRCTHGAIHDVIVDLRRGSPTFTRHVAAVLSAENRQMLYVPEGFAHGFQTLSDDSEVFYQISEIHSPEHARGLRWNDPAFGIEWPLAVTTMAERDRTYPDFRAEDFA